MPSLGPMILAITGPMGVAIGTPEKWKALLTIYLQQEERSLAALLCRHP